MTLFTGIYPEDLFLMLFVTVNSEKNTSSQFLSSYVKKTLTHLCRLDWRYENDSGSITKMKVLFHS